MKEYLKKLAEETEIPFFELETYWKLFSEEYSFCKITEDVKKRFLLYLEDIQILNLM